MSKFNYEEMVTVKVVSDSTYDIVNKRVGVGYTYEDDYHLYLTEVSFNNDGTVTGKFGGDAKAMFVDDYCETMKFNEDKNIWVAFPSEMQMTKGNFLTINNKKEMVLFT